MCVRAFMRPTYLSVMSFVNHGIVWACIYYMDPQLIISEAHALAHRASPEGQHTSALPSLTPCRMSFVSSTVIGFSGPHVCPEIDQVEYADPSRLPWPRLQRHQSLTCCFTSDTNTWEKDGVQSDPGSCCFAFDGFCFPTSWKHFYRCLNPPKTLFICVSSYLIWSKVHLVLLLSAVSIPRRKHTGVFDQSCPI